MPDNIRLRMSNKQVKEPKLDVTTLSPGDCVRGWITFQKPKGVKPKFVVYSRGRSVTKWAIPER